MTGAAKAATERRRAMTDINIPDALDVPKTREWSTWHNDPSADPEALADAAIAELLGLVAEWDRMLRLAWGNPVSGPPLSRWLADLKARAKEGSE